MAEKSKKQEKQEKPTEKPSSGKEGKDTLQRKYFVGTVVSTKRQKTVGVRVGRFIKHPLYGKRMKRTKVFAVHNETFDLAVGDVVWIESVRPISKTKSFQVTEKVEGQKGI